MNATNLRLGVAALLIAGVVAILIFQQRSESALRERNELLGQKLAQLSSENVSLSNRLAQMKRSRSPRLPAPQIQTISTPVPADNLAGTNLLGKLRNGEALRLSPEQVQHYVEENHRSAASLLSAYRTSKDPALLAEAMEKFPNDPQVAFEAIFKSDSSPAERRQWLEAFKSAAPDNGLANYLSALDYFKTGQTDQAVQELMAASGKPGFSDYTLERIQSNAEAFRSAGYSEAETQMASTWGITLPQLAELKALGQNMTQLADSYRKSGDEASAQAALQMAIGLGQQLDGTQGTSVPLITRMVGMAVERMALGSMDPASQYGDGTVQGQFDGLAQRRTAMKGLVNQAGPLYDQMTGQDWINYSSRTVTFGEENAIHWLLTKYGQK